MSAESERLDSLTGEQVNLLYHSLFSTDNGKLVLEDLRRIGFHYETTIGRNTDETIANEGSRRLLLHILSKLNPIKETPKNMEGP